jgi:hypothetical protein
MEQHLNQFKNDLPPTSPIYRQGLTHKAETASLKDEVPTQLQKDGSLILADATKDPLATYGM